MTAELDKARTELIERTQNSLIQSEKMASLGKLAATVAHELNNPLFGILTYARLALKQVKREELTLEERERLADKLTLIERESKRSGEIVKNLLTFARQAPRKVGEHDLNQLVERALAVVRHRLELQQVALESKLDPNLPKVACDEGQLQQVMLVLLVNAIEAMPDRGSLQLRSAGPERRFGGRRQHQRHRFRHRAGRDVAYLRAVLHHQGRDQRVGLGLAIAHGIIAQHGGTITVQSEPGKGAEFTISLPLVNPLAAEKKRRLFVSKGKVLIVDDEGVVRSSLTEWFASEGYNTRGVSERPRGSGGRGPAGL